MPPDEALRVAIELASTRWTAHEERAKELRSHARGLMTVTVAVVAAVITALGRGWMSGSQAPPLTVRVLLMFAVGASLGTFITAVVLRWRRLRQSANNPAPKAEELLAWGLSTPWDETEALGQAWLSLEGASARREEENVELYGEIQLVQFGLITGGLFVGVALGTSFITP